VNVEEFFAKLSESKLFYNWEHNSTFGMLRGIGSNSGTFCPITSVCNTIYEKWFPIHEFDVAGHIIGLSYVESYAIMRASDNQCGNEAERNIRKRLLSILCEEGCAA
jgi:hypothetical protein